MFTEEYNARQAAYDLRERVSLSQTGWTKPSPGEEVELADVLVAQASPPSCVQSPIPPWAVARRDGQLFLCVSPRDTAPRTCRETPCDNGNFLDVIKSAQTPYFIGFLGDSVQFFLRKKFGRANFQNSIFLLAKNFPLISLNPPYKFSHRCNHQNRPFSQWVCIQASKIYTHQSHNASARISEYQQSPIQFHHHIHP